MLRRLLPILPLAVLLLAATVVVLCERGCM